MCTSEPLLQSLEVHGRQRSARAAIDTGKGLQHLGWQVTREKEEENKIEEKKSLREDKRCEVEKQGKEEREQQIIFNLIHV